MDIIEGPAGYSADSILIRYQLPCTVEEQDVEGDNLNLYQDQPPQQGPQQPLDGDDMTVKSSDSTTTNTTSLTATSTATSTKQQQRNHYCKIRRRQLRRQALDDHIWFVVTRLERFAKNFTCLRLRFVGCSFPAPALAWLLERVSRITRLELRVTFHGALGDLQRSLGRHPQLKHVSMDHCRPSLEDLYWNLDTELATSNNEAAAVASKEQRKSRRHHRRHEHRHHHHPQCHRHQMKEYDDGSDAESDNEDYKRLDKSSLAKKKPKSLKKAPPPKIASLEPFLDGLAQSKTLQSLTLSHSTIAYTMAATTAATANQLEDIDETATISSRGAGAGSIAPSTNNQDHGIIAWNAGASLSQFLRMPSLDRLLLEHMPEIRDEDFCVMAKTLETRHTLRTLSIRQCAVGPATGVAMGSMLQRNRGLQTMDLNVHWWDGLSYEETPNGEYAAKCYVTNVVPLLRGLRSNSSLKCLGLYCDTLSYSSAHAMAVVNILGEEVQESTNRLCEAALKELPAIFQSPSSTDKNNVIGQQNRVLEDVIIGHRSCGLTPEIDFYLNWNRAGRNYFSYQDNPSKYDWMDAILNHREDLSVVYALVSMSPTMFR